jgi:hypothetical protein
MSRLRAKGRVMNLFSRARERRGLARGAFGATPKNSSLKEFADLTATYIQKWSEVLEREHIERDLVASRRPKAWRRPASTPGMARGKARYDISFEPKADAFAKAAADRHRRPGEALA